MYLIAYPLRLLIDEIDLKYEEYLKYFVNNLNISNITKTPPWNLIKKIILYAY